MKRHSRMSSSSDSSDNEGPSTSFCPSDKQEGILGAPVSEPKKPAEVFRKDLISAMKLPDSHHIPPEDYYLLADSWRQEWEKGVQVLANPDAIPLPSLRVVVEQPRETLFSRPKKYMQSWSRESADAGCVSVLEMDEAVCRYDLDDMDLHWLRELNSELEKMGDVAVDELTMERAMEALERRCHNNMNHAIETEEGLGIEYDEDVVCDVCRCPDSEEGNDMVFCDKCNVCVHQACYGIVKVPEGCWLCRTCVLGIDPQCLLCPKKGGAMKPTRTGTQWTHVSCALWIPEVSIACPERMEPITKVSHIPPSRWALVCSLCKLKTGACIQCSVKSCTVPFHVTCAFEHSLEMKTVLDEGDEVKFKSYCLKHSRSKAPEPGVSPARQQPPAEAETPGVRARRLRELQEEFYSLVWPEELAEGMALPAHALDFVYQYWKLKRKSSFDRPLLAPREEESELLQPERESVHTRMRMFMHLRQDLERVRNLCYMVSRREKLKLSQSKAQEQIFNLQVALLDQELSTGLPVSYPPDSGLLQPPPRIMLKLKMPRVDLGNRNSTHGPLSPDHSANVCEKGGRSQGRGRGRREGKPNGLLRGTGAAEMGVGMVTPVRPSGKPLALQAALRGQQSNGSSKGKPDRTSRPNGALERPAGQRDSCCQTSCDRDTCSDRDGPHGGFRSSTVEHFSRSFKEASASLTQAAVGLRGPGKAPQKGTPAERTWPRSALQRQPDDGYCPDLELSDTEPEAQIHRDRGAPGRGAGSRSESLAWEDGRGGTRAKTMVGMRTSANR